MFPLRSEPDPLLRLTPACGTSDPDVSLQSVVIIEVFALSSSSARKMRLGTMAILVALLLTATRRSEGSSLAEPAQRQQRRRHQRGSNLRPSRWRRREQRRRRLDEALEERLTSTPQSLPPLDLPAGQQLQLPADLAQMQLTTAAAALELEQGRHEVRHRYSAPQDDATVCCPAVEERTSPLAGARLDGTPALLDTTGGVRQIFFESSCRNQTSRETVQLSQHLRRRHTVRCVQEYSYSLAVYNINGSRVLDYMRIRSGCRCDLVAPSGGRRRRKGRRERQRERRRKQRRNRDRRRKKARRRSQSTASEAPS